MFCRRAPLLGALLVFASVSLPGVVLHAEEAPVPAAPVASPAPAPGHDRLAPILELLRSKNVITDEEAAALARQGAEKADLKPLIELLRAKGVVSDQEAARLGSAQPHGLSEAGVHPPSQDHKFLSYLRERWVKNKNRGRDFDEWFAGVEDPEEIIGKMQLMGGIAPEEAEELRRTYRDTYLSGAISAVMEKKESEYLERVRKGVAWELDDKVAEKFKDQWSQRIKLSGEIRLRWEQDLFDRNNYPYFINPSNTTQIMNSQIDRERARLLARLGVEIKLAEDWHAGLVIGTDNARTPGNPGSSYVTLGDSFNKKPIALDRAYLNWTPCPAVSFWGGRFANPYLYTDLVWSPEIKFDGFALQVAPQLSQNWKLFSTVGGYFLQEVELSSHDKYLVGGQLGVEHKTPENLTTKLAVAYYHYFNTTGVVNDPSRPTLTDWTAPLYQQKGNTLMDIDPSSAIKTAYAADFHELDVNGVLDLGYWEPVHLTLYGDYVNNLGFSQRAVNARTGFNVKKETEGFQVGLWVGMPAVKELWDWRAGFSYKYIESDAVMDAFNDQDFHLGGTNAKGWVVGGDLGVAKNVWLAARWLSTDVISGLPLAIDVFQLNLNASF
ncbi:putative porin [Geomesophilobacter sediminis]|uniref:Putative porin n=1 Tax=Geomesophilobacter sediminis TaxID=2798584 RepID=A0A8J7JKX6_9BACT|nr:putative porin [Geomesophilobacter sediminis]MBJ6724280.1 putative porin [Geomesophilobacter sediminis]